MTPQKKEKETIKKKDERIVPMPSSILLADDDSVQTEVLDTSGNEPKQTDRFGLDSPEVPRVGVLIAKRFDRNYLTRAQIAKLAELEKATRLQSEKRLNRFLDDLEESLKRHNKGRTVSNMIDRAAKLNMRWHGWNDWTMREPGGQVEPERPMVTPEEPEPTPERQAEALRRVQEKLRKRFTGK